MSNIDSYVHLPSTEFKALPEIYQIEATNHCNLKCPMCLRTTDMVRSADHVDQGLIRAMLARGDFAGTSYTELQLAGEPTLHPQLGEIISLIKGHGILVGASTHGLLIGKKAGVLEALLSLDALTVSCDSVDPETYSKMRYPAQLPQLIAAVDLLVDALKSLPSSKRPFVELQLVQLNDARGIAGSGNLFDLEVLMRQRGWDEVCTARVQSDCFPEMQKDVVQIGGLKRNASLCINPWSSVSVAADGSVVSCCYVFEPSMDSPNTYGNLREQSLAEIWDGRRVQAMRESHRTGDLGGQCRACYLKSPTLIHANIVSRLVRHKCLST